MRFTQNWNQMIESAKERGKEVPGLRKDNLRMLMQSEAVPDL